MALLAEISDKMPSTWLIVVAAVIASAACARLAVVNRTVTWSMLAVAVAFGATYLAAIAVDAFGSSALRNAIWAELGWTWVLANVFSPLLPTACILMVLFRRRSAPRGRGSPIDGWGAQG